MENNWQFWVVIACVLLAAWQVGLRIWRGLTASDEAGSCGNCHGCASGSQQADPPLVQLDLGK